MFFFIFKNLLSYVVYLNSTTNRSKASFDDSVNYNECGICEKDMLPVEIDQEMTDLMNSNKAVKDAVSYVKGHEPCIRYTCCGRGIHGPCHAQCEEDNVNQCVTKGKCPNCGKKYKKRGTSAEAKFVVKWAKQGAEWASQWLVDQAEGGNEHAQKEGENVGKE